MNNMALIQTQSNSFSRHFPNQSLNESTHRIRVRVLDHHPVVRAGIYRALSDAYDLVAEDIIETGTPAKEAPPPDVVILDISLRDVVNPLSNATDAPRMVGFTEVSEAALIKSSLAKGVNGFVHRTESLEILVSAIRAVAADKRYLSPESQRILAMDQSDDTGLDPAISTDREKALVAVATLTPREVQVLQMIADGNTSNAVAHKLQLSVKTIETHRKHVGDKIGTKNVARLTKIALLTGLTTLEI